MKTSLKLKEETILLTGRARDEDIKALFELLGMIAKAGGRVSQDSVNEVERLISAYLDPTQRQYAISCFRAGKDCPGLGASVTKRAFHLYGFRDHEDVERWLEPLQILDILLRVAFADRQLTTEAEYIIDHTRSTLAVHKRAYCILRDTLAERLGVNLNNEGKSFASMTSSKEKAESPKVKPSKLTRSEALKIFSLTEDAEIKEIKSVYRAYVKQYHPDAIMKDKASDSEIKEAIKIFCSIQEAYDLLTSSKDNK